MSFQSYQCPKTGTPLKKATDPVVITINEAIDRKEVFTVSGQEVDKKIHSIWICTETKHGYAERDGIVCLITSDALRLKNLDIDFQQLTTEN